jgi:hypothetical protein
MNGFQRIALEELIKLIWLEQEGVLFPIKSNARIFLS